MARMLAIPVPLLSALLLAVLTGVLLQKRGDARTTVFVALCACMALLVGLRWRFPHPYWWFAVAIVSGLQAPVAWLCFCRPMPEQPSSPSAIYAVYKWLPFLTLPLISALLLAGGRYWDGVEVLLVVQYMAYGVILLTLGWRDHRRFDALRLSQEPELRRAAVWAGWTLIINGVVEGAIALDYWLYQGRHAPLLVSATHVLLLPPLVYGVIRAGEIFASKSAADQPEAESGRTGQAHHPTAAAGEHSTPVPPLAAGLHPPRFDGAAIIRPACAAPRDEAAILAQLTDLVHAQGLFRDPDLSLMKLARRMGVPARELSGIVNRRCGKNMAQWVNGFRIQAACEQLATGDAPITTVMLDCGFFTKSNFNREFLRHTGMSPSAYRQQARNAWTKQTVRTSQ